MRVMLSIKPEYVEKILNMTKLYEFRKIRFGKDEIDKIVIYATAPIGKVVGEFDIADVLEDTPEHLWEITKAASGVNEEFYFKYFNGKRLAYALRIGNPIRYPIPLELKDFNINTPPQSFAYIPSASSTSSTPTPNSMPTLPCSKNGRVLESLDQTRL